MSRSALALIAGLSLIATTAADACSCIPYRSQAEADRAGEKVWRDAALIVEATVGDVSAAYRAMCPAGGGKPRATDIGRRMNEDRPITIHRVLKGRAPAAPILAGREATVYPQGCGVMTSSCDVGIQSGARTILVLTGTVNGRWQMTDFCSLMALRQSTRGRALFGHR